MCRRLSGHAILCSQGKWGRGGQPRPDALGSLCPVRGCVEPSINLLKLLTNPYIVEYIESFNTKESLYIVMEFVENGSLSQIVKRFGRLNESLVGIYTLQAPLFIAVISAARR